MKALVALHQEVRACRRCFPEGGNRPVISGPADAEVLIIGQAPSRTDAETGRTFSGPGGKRLREWLRTAGIDPANVYFGALTKCYPGPAPNGKGDRVPTRAEIDACRPYLEREIVLLRPRIVLLVGGAAIREFLGKRTLAEAVGQVFPAREVPFFAGLLDDGADRWVIPLPHCSGASLWLNRPEHRALLERALARLRELMTDDDSER